MGIAAKTPDLAMLTPQEITVSAVEFNASTDYIQYSNNFFRDTDLRYNQTGALTLSLWFRWEQLYDAVVGPMLISVASGSITNIYHLFMQSDTSVTPNRYRLVFIYEDDNSNLNSIVSPYSTTTLAANTWHHVLLTMQSELGGSGAMAIDDTVVSTTVSYAGSIGDIPAATTDTYIGSMYAFNPAQPPVLDGQMAEIWMKDQYYNITNQNTRRLFISENAKPVQLPANPLVYLHGDATTWTNSGSTALGTQTLNSITTATTSPSD